MADRPEWDDMLRSAIATGAAPDPTLPLAAAVAAAQAAASASVWEQLAGDLLERGAHGAAAKAVDTATHLLVPPRQRAELIARWAGLNRVAGRDEEAAARERVARRLRGQANGERLPELEAVEGYVLCRANAPDDFAQALASVGDNPLDDDPLRSWNAPNINVALASERFGASDDLSFLVLDEAGPVLVVACDVSGDQMLTRGEAAVVLTPMHAGLPIWAEALALRQLRYLARWSGAGRVLLESGGGVAERAWIDDTGVAAFEMALCDIDLGQEMETIRQGYRQTHRQQVAWGRKHLRVERVADPGGLYEPLCQLYRDGSHLTPQFTAASLRQPGVAMVAAWLDEQLAAVVVTTDCGRVTYYCAGARRGGSSQPLTHVLIDSAIAEAKARGQARFSFGMLHVDAAAPAKLKGIAGFKRGFAPTLTRCRWLTLPA